ncbi:MAG: response regulator [Planctomycetales bacterium]|nr:response regulator [Planctomycetales bacterium]NIM08836.1 response regulator [Planctomycetales bacterium]NIN08297.1 response regulator [Planctomycetales bacterium]NIN77426.1 response regulator [Planctomycetales bacterium]NIO34600.1 response regulator [Planctomycetales bacterium]
MDKRRPVEILLVEDSPVDARLVQECFEESSVPNRLHVVTNGEDALDFLTRQASFIDAARPDLILLDLNIPRIHGLTLLSTVKSDPQLKHIPVIVLTASAIEEDIHRAYQLQANSYLSKPTDLSGFRDMIKSLESHWLSCAHLPSQPMVDSPAVGESHDLAEPSCGGEAS